MHTLQTEIICIGTEIVSGSLLNTNASYISNELLKLGIETQKFTTVPDEPNLLSRAIKSAIKTADLTFLTGGLGPTFDDITLNTLAKTLNRKLTLKKDILRNIQTHFNKQGIVMPKDNIRQAYIPQGSTAIKNEIGTAPGLIMKYNKRTIIALPGPPGEVAPMMEESIIPFIKQRFKTTKIIKTRILKITGLAESQVNELVKDILGGSPGLSLGIYAHPGQIDIKITATAPTLKEAEKLISSCEERIRQRLGDYIFTTDKQTLEEVVAQLLFKNKKTLSVAESCTGGLLTNRLTNISGSSKYLIASVIAYSNKAKTEVLKLPKDIIQKYGAVSKETALFMAKNIKRKTKSDLGISITGIAGPTGGTKEKPVGLVYISLITEKQQMTKEFHFTGSRETIKLKSTQAALDIIRKSLLKTNE